MTVPDLNSISLRLDTVNLVQNADASFQSIGPMPQWLSEFGCTANQNEPFALQDYLLFFDTFLLEVADALSRDPSLVLSSGPWSELDQKGTIRNLSALAMQDNGHLVIQIKLVAEAQQYQQAVFQQARSYSLKFEELSREKEHKEILLHAIVHDLTGPLTAIQGVLELMQRGKFSEELTAIAVDQCGAQYTMINSILEAFVAESSNGRLPISRSEAPDIIECTRLAYVKFKAAFENKNVTLLMTQDIDADGLKVAAEADLLDRVFANLLENALRHSPPGSQTELRISGSGEFVSVAILDEGPGISDGIKTSIFNRFSSGGVAPGKMGLGLHFCKITVESWGGNLHCENRQDNPGSVFEFQIKRWGAD